MRRRALAVVTTVALALAASAHATPVIYDQPLVDNDTVWASQNDPNLTVGYSDFAKVYDNFTLATDSTLTDVHWYGGYFNGSKSDSPSSFLIEFWSDASGTPNTLLDSVTITGAAGETSVLSSNPLFPLFSYGADIPGFSVAAGTYWLSIQPTLGFPPQWGWNMGSGGDGRAVQDFLGTRSSLPNDMAFSLTGTKNASTVPEPSTMVLLGSGIVGIAGAARRRAKKA